MNVGTLENPRDEVLEVKIAGRAVASYLLLAGVIAMAAGLFGSAFVAFGYMLVTGVSHPPEEAWLVGFVVIFTGVGLLVWRALKWNMLGEKVAMLLPKADEPMGPYAGLGEGLTNDLKIHYFDLGVAYDALTNERWTLQLQVVGKSIPFWPLGLGVLYQRLSVLEENLRACDYRRRVRQHNADMAWVNHAISEPQVPDGV